MWCSWSSTESGHWESDESNDVDSKHDPTSSDSNSEETESDFLGFKSTRNWFHFDDPVVEENTSHLLGLSYSISVPQSVQNFTNLSTCCDANDQINVTALSISWSIFFTAPWVCCNEDWGNKLTSTARLKSLACYDHYNLRCRFALISSSCRRQTVLRAATDAKLMLKWSWVSIYSAAANVCLKHEGVYFGYLLGSWKV